MSAHRFWRLVCHRVNGNSHFGLTEWFLALTPGGPQAAVGGTASASSTLPTWAAPSVVFNDATGSGSTNHWFTNGGYDASGFGSGFIQYDMGAGNTLDPVEMRLAYDHTNLHHAPVNFSVWVSEDGTSWTLYRVWGGETWSSNTQTKTYDISTPMSASEMPGVLLPNRLDFREIQTAHSGPANNYQVRGAFLKYRDYNRIPRWTPFAGNGYIAGSTTVLGDPARRRVDLIEQNTGVLYDRQYTGPDGLFYFDYLGPGPWTLLGTDITGNQNSVVYAHLTPEPMT